MRLRPLAAIYMTSVAWAAVLSLVTTILLIVLGAGDESFFWFVVVGAAAAAGALAGYRVRLEVDTEEIRVFNVGRTYRIPWESVTKIDVTAWWLSPSAVIAGNAAVRVSMRDGRRVVIDASTREAARVLDVFRTFARGVEIELG